MLIAHAGWATAVTLAREQATRQHPNDLSLDTETTTTVTLLDSVLHFTM